MTVDKPNTELDHGSTPSMDNFNGEEGNSEPITAFPTPSIKWHERPALRKGLNLLTAVLVALAAVLTWQRFASGQVSDRNSNIDPALAHFGETLQDLADLKATPDAPSMELPSTGIGRMASLLTIIPPRARSEVITYTVKSGDNLISIAEHYGLKPETVLWSNFDVLEDNPHLLQPDQKLAILPVDGVYYQWQEGDTLESVAEKFKTDPEEILNSTANDFDLAVVSVDSSSIEPDTWVVVPHGERPFKDWGPPTISRDNPASAAYYGPGHCGEIYTGPVGTGSFIWPTNQRWLSGYHYSSIHRGIDIGGKLGDAIYASDSGVIVYSGWTNTGYGNLIVIDHGNGFQTAYAHLSSMNVACGDAVFQGAVIGAMGSTGNSTGPHLHFELYYNGTKPNPFDYIP